MAFIPEKKCNSPSAGAALNKNQIAASFLGTVRRFPNGAPTIPIDQGEESTVSVEFYTRFTGKSQAQLKAH